MGELSRSYGSGKGLLKLQLDGLHGLTREQIIGFNGEGLLKFFQGLVEHSLFHVYPSKIAVGIMKGCVSICPGGLLEPWNGLFQLAEVDQVSSNVVVWIAKGRIRFDGLFTLVDGILVAGLES